MASTKKLNKTILLFILIFLIGIIGFVIYINGSFTSNEGPQTTGTVIEVTEVTT